MLHLYTAAREMWFKRTQIKKKKERETNKVSFKFPFKKNIVSEKSFLIFFRGFGCKHFLMHLATDYFQAREKRDRRFFP